MQHYSVKIDSIPEILFAHEYITDHYDISFSERINFMEISYLIEGDTVRCRANERILVPQGSFVVSCRKEPERFYSEGRQHHITIGFRAEITNGDLLLPEYIHFRHEEKPLHRLRQLIAEYTLNGKTSMKAIGMLFEFLGELDAEYRKYTILDSVSYGEQRYAEAAKRYIVSRVREKVYVSEIAAEVGVSVAYLSSIFKRCTGMTLVEYMNITKLNLVKSLVRHDSLSVKNAARAVGFTDENYVSRIYKKYFGINLTDDITLVE